MSASPAHQVIPSPVPAPLDAALIPVVAALARMTARRQRGDDSQPKS